MIKIKRLTAITTASLLISVSTPQKAEANPLAIPAAAGCIASIGCVCKIEVEVS